MASLQDKILEAKKAGYSEDEIFSHVSSLPEYKEKTKLALDEGYKPTEILSYLSGSKAPEMGAEKPLEAPKPSISTGRVAVEALKRVPVGIAESFAQLPENIVALGKAAYGTGAILAGRPELAPEATLPPARIERALQEKGYLESLEGMTPEQKLLYAGVQGAGAAALQPVQGLKQVAANVLKGAVAGGGGEAVTQATGSELAGIATSMLAPGIMTKRGEVKAGALDKLKKQNAQRDVTLREASEAGFVIPPGEVSPTAKNVLLESMAGKTALEQLASSKNQATVNKLARKAVSLPEDAPLTTQTMKDIRADEFAKGYAPLRAIGEVGSDVNYALDLNTIARQRAAAGRSFPKAESDDVKRLLDAYSVNKFDSGDALDAIRILREDATASFRKGESGLGKAQQGVANALERQLERHLASMGDAESAEKLAQFQASRKRMAISHVIEDAINEGDGSVSAREIAKKLKKDQYLTGELKTIAKFARAFPRAAQPPSAVGTPAANKLQAGLAALSPGGLGGIAGGIAGGVPGAIAGAAVPFAVRQYLTSGVAQRRMIPDYRNRLAEMMSQPVSEPALMSTLLGLQAAQSPQQ